MEKISRFGIALGMMEDSTYKAGNLVLEAGDRLLLFTDGFIDAVNHEDMRYGEERLEETVKNVRALPSREFIESITKDVDDFAGEVPQFDDLTALVATFLDKKPLLRSTEVST